MPEMIECLVIIMHCVDEIQLETVNSYEVLEIHIYHLACQEFIQISQEQKKVTLTKVCIN